jgi:hypothetical protein
MTAERGGHSSSDGSSSKDPGTQTVKAVILVAVVVVVGILVLKNTGSGPKPISSTSPTTAPPATSIPAPTVTTTTAPTATAPANPASVKVLVLNGTDTSGAATYFTNKLHSAGYNTLAASNATARNVSTTMVYSHTPGSSAAAVAHTLGLQPTSVATSVPANAPVDQTLLQQDNPNVLVVIGSDISSQATSGASSSSTTAPASPSAPATTAPPASAPATTAPPASAPATTVPSAPATTAPAPPAT